MTRKIAGVNTIYEAYVVTIHGKWLREINDKNGKITATAHGAFEIKMKKKIVFPCFKYLFSYLKYLFFS